LKEPLQRRRELIKVDGSDGVGEDSRSQDWTTEQAAKRFGVPWRAYWELGCAERVKAKQLHQSLVIESFYSLGHGQVAGQDFRHGKSTEKCSVCGYCLLSIAMELKFHIVGCVV